MIDKHLIANNLFIFFQMMPVFGTFIGINMLKNKKYTRLFANE